VDIAPGQFAELGDQIMRQQRAVFVFFVALKPYSERISHNRLRPSHRLASLLHAPDEATIEVEFGIRGKSDLPLHLKRESGRLPDRTGWLVTGDSIPLDAASAYTSNGLIPTERYHS
jgi:hypothetical protein